MKALVDAALHAAGLTTAVAAGGDGADEAGTCPSVSGAWTLAADCFVPAGATVRWTDATVTVAASAIDHPVVTVRGTLLIERSSVRNADGAPDATWLLLVPNGGRLVVRNAILSNAGIELAEHASADVDGLTFGPSIASFAVDTSAATIRRSLFHDNSGVALNIRNGSLVELSTFAHNTYGINVQSPLHDPVRTSPTIRNNDFRFNAVGVQWSGRSAAFTGNNVYHNYAEGILDVTILPSQTLDITDTYFDGDPAAGGDTFYSDGGRLIYARVAPVAAPYGNRAAGAPPLPFEPVVADGRDPAHARRTLAPVVEGPWIARHGGVIESVAPAGERRSVDQNGWFVGVNAHGTLRVERTDFSDAGTLVLRSGADEVVDVSATGGATRPFVYSRALPPARFGEIHMSDGGGGLHFLPRKVDLTGKGPAYSMTIENVRSERGGGIVTINLASTVRHYIADGVEKPWSAVFDYGPVLADSSILGADTGYGSALGAGTTKAERVRIEGSKIGFLATGTVDIADAEFHVNGVGMSFVGGAGTVVRTNADLNYLDAIRVVATGPTMQGVYVGDDGVSGMPREGFSPAPVQNDAPGPVRPSPTTVIREDTVLTGEVTLAGPMIVKAGTLRIQDANVDLAGVPLGSAGGNLIIEDSTLRDGAFMAAADGLLEIRRSRILDGAYGALAAYRNDATSLIEDTWFRSGGTIAVDVRDSRIAIVGSVFDRTAGTALNVESLLDPPALPAIVSQNTFHRTRYLCTTTDCSSFRLVARDDAPPILRAHDQQFVATRWGAISVYGLVTQGNGVLDLANSYWGHPSGPSDVDGNDGSGAAVHTPQTHVSNTQTPAEVRYSPWRTSDLFATFEWTPREDILEGETVTFRQTSDIPGRIVSWSWDFGDGTTAEGGEVTHAFAVGGRHTVTMRAIDRSGFAHVAEASLVVNVAPAPAFSWSPQPTTRVVDTQFTDLSTDVDDGLASWTWNFADGATSSVRHPSHRFSSLGPHPVTLTVADAAGQARSITHDVLVVNVPPAAAFVAPSGEAGEALQFADGSSDPDGTVVAWSWDFGDGATSTAQNPSHAYAADGAYVARLTVTDNDGGTASTARTVYVGNLPPVASFSWCCLMDAPSTIGFRDASSDGDGSIATWSWSFGDGSTSTARNPQHTYARSGAYPVVLTVKDDRGAEASIVRTVVADDRLDMTTTVTPVPGGVEVAVAVVWDDGRPAVDVPVRWRSYQLVFTSGGINGEPGFEETNVVTTTVRTDAEGRAAFSLQLQPGTQRWTTTADTYQGLAGNREMDVNNGSVIVV